MSNLNDALIEEIEDLNLIIESRNSCIKALKESHGKLLEKYRESCDYNSILDSSLSNMSKHATRHDENHNREVMKVKELEKEIKYLNEIIECRNSYLDLCNMKMLEKDNRIEELKEKNKKLSSANFFVNKSDWSLDSANTITALKGQIKDLVNKIRNWEETCLSLRLEIKELNKTIKDLDGNPTNNSWFEACESERAELKKEIFALEDARHIDAARIEDLQEQLGVINEMHEYVVDENRELDKKLDSLDKSYNHAVNGLNGRNECLEKESKNNTNHLSDLYGRIERLVLDKNNLSQELLKANENRKDALDEVAKLREELKELNNANGCIDRCITLKNENLDLKKKLISLNDCCDSHSWNSECQIGILEQEIKGRGIEIEELKKSIKAHKKAYLGGWFQL